MAKSTLEIDFFRGESRRAPSPSFPSPDLGLSAFSGIQKVVSRINPNLLKTAMASSRPNNSNRVPISKCCSSSSSEFIVSFFSLSDLRPLATLSRSPPETAPLTIFYNGTVAAFHLPRDKVFLRCKSPNSSSSIAIPALRSKSSSLETLGGGHNRDGGESSNRLPEAGRIPARRRSADREEEIAEEILGEEEREMQRSGHGGISSPPLLGWIVMEDPWRTEDAFQLRRRSRLIGSNVMGPG